MAVSYTIRQHLTIFCNILPDLLMTGNIFWLNPPAPLLIAPTLIFVLTTKIMIAWFTSTRGIFMPTFDGRQPLMEDHLQWNMSFDGRRPSMEDNLRWKTTFDGRPPLMEDNLWWKTTFDGRQPLMEDDLRCRAANCCGTLARGAQ